MIETLRIQSCILSLASCLALVGGCSRVPARVLPPEIPDDAGASAISKYDSNGDGALGGAELEQIPSIKSALQRFDANQDNKVDADEITARLKEWRDTKVGLMRGSVKVLLDGRPLQGAEVRLLPEEFLGDAIQPATGITDNEGRARLKISEERRSGMQLGLYKIQISKKSGDREVIPSNYNSQTTLGVEIAPNTIGGDWTINLTQK